MKDHEKIVIGTSLASESDAVVDAGIALALATGAAVELVHALPKPVDLYVGVSGLDAVGGDWFRILEQDLRERLDAQAAARGLERVRHVRRVELDLPHRALVARATATGASLIVLGAAVGGRPRRRLLGSTADRVIRKAACPVLVVRPGCAMPPARILVATDLSAAAGGVLRRGLDLAAPAGGTRPAVQVLFVRTVGSETSLHFSPEQMHRFADEELRRVVAEALPGGPPARCVLRKGDPSGEILAEAESWKPDLLVVGTHGASGLERAILGSVAAHVVHDALCSVLVVPSAAAAAEERPADADWAYVADDEPDEVSTVRQRISPSG
ncbi:MAG TPA: universal stress protein [Thermoanaerobaculia bacterium]